MASTDLFRLDGRTVVLIGVGGIGVELARALADFGARVVCADIDGALAMDVAASLPNASGHALDLTDPVAVETLAAELGAVDALVVTAGANIRKPLLNYTPDELDRVLALNLKGPFFAIQSFGRRMAEAGRGSITIFSSLRAHVVEPGQSAYAAAKAGVLKLVATAAAELGPQGVRVNAICPGVMETPLTAQIKQSPDWYAAYADASALKRWGQPHELVGAVIWLASDASTFVTGAAINVDGGWTAIDGRFDPPLPRD
ncbi:SDR family NAD(P)-dependent oxidoreductase [Mariniluteicoccus flavus]